MPLLIDRDSSRLFHHTESVARRSQGSLLGSIAAGFSGGFRRVEQPNPDAKLPRSDERVVVVVAVARTGCVHVCRAR